MLLFYHPFSSWLPYQYLSFWGLSKQFSTWNKYKYWIALFARTQRYCIPFLAPSQDLISFSTFRCLPTGHWTLPSFLSLSILTWNPPVYAKLTKSGRIAPEMCKTARHCCVFSKYSPNAGIFTSLCAWCLSGESPACYSWEFIWRTEKV